MLLLVGEGLVGHVGDVQGRLLVIGERTPGVRGTDDHFRVRDARAVAGQGIGTLEAQVGDRRVQGLHPVLLVHVPGGGDVPRRQPAGGAGLAQTVRTLVAVGAVEGVAALVGIGAVREESDAAAAGVGDREVLGVLLGTLLEHVPVVVGDLAEIVLHAPAAEPDAVTVDVVDLGAAEQVHDVVIEERVVVGGRGTDVPAVHAVVRTLVDTAHGEDRHREGVRVLRVRVQERVDVTDGGGGHLAVGEGLVGRILDVVLLGGGGGLVGGQGAQVQVRERLVLQFALHAEVMDLQVDVVVVELVQDVELRIVAGVELIRVQSAGSVQRVGVRVDVEVTFHLAGDHVHFTVDGTGRTLVAVGGVADEVRRQLVGELVGDVQVAGVTADRTLLGPTRIAEGGQGGVVGTLAGTAGNAHRVVVLDRVVEQDVEPVRVAELGGAEVGVSRRLGVREAEGAAGFVILGDQLVHLAVDTAVAGVGRLGVVQVTLLLELLVDFHLVLGVHDVEGVVAGLEPIGVFAGVADLAGSGGTLLGRDDDNARHGARTVDGSGGTVLEDVEALDIVGVQAGDGRGDQGVGVTGRQVVRAHVHDIFHDHAVHDPQGLGGTVDGGGAADADLRGGTERTGDVLHGHAGRTSLEGAGDIRHTADVRFLGIHLHGGTGVHAAVHRVHTVHDRTFKDFGIVLEDDLHVGCDRDTGIFRAHEGRDDVLGAFGNVLDLEVTVQVRDAAEFRALNGHVAARDRGPVRGGGHIAPDRTVLGQCDQRRERKRQ